MAVRDIGQPRALNDEWRRLRVTIARMADVRLMGADGVPAFDTVFQVRAETADESVEFVRADGRCAHLGEIEYRAKLLTDLIGAPGISYVGPWPTSPRQKSAEPVAELAKAK